MTARAARIVALPRHARHPRAHRASSARISPGNARAGGRSSAATRRTAVGGGPARRAHARQLSARARAHRQVARRRACGGEDRCRSTAAAAAPIGARRGLEPRRDRMLAGARTAATAWSTPAACPVRRRRGGAPLAAAGGARRAAGADDVAAAGVTRAGAADGAPAPERAPPGAVTGGVAGCAAGAGGRVRRGRRGRGPGRLRVADPRGRGRRHARERRAAAHREHREGRLRMRGREPIVLAARLAPLAGAVERRSRAGTARRPGRRPPRPPPASCGIAFSSSFASWRTRRRGSSASPARAAPRASRPSAASSGAIDLGVAAGLERGARGLERGVDLHHLRSLRARGEHRALGASTAARSRARRACLAASSACPPRAAS